LLTIDTVVDDTILPNVNEETVIPAQSSKRMEFNACVQQSLKSTSGIKVQLIALADTGADLNVISSSLVAKHGWTTIKGSSLSVSFADGSQTRCNDYCEVRLSVGNYNQLIRFAVMETDQDVILGIPWFESIQVTKLDCYNSVLRFYTKSNRKKSYLWFGTSHSTFAHNVSIYSCSVNSINLEKEECFEVEVCAKKKPATTLDSLISDSDPLIGDVLKEFSDVFNPISHVNELPHRDEDQKIRLKPDSETPFCKLRRFSAKEDAALVQWVTDNLDNGRIVVSKSSYSANVLLVKKKDGTLRVCVDWRALNNITEKDRTPLTSCSEVREHVRGSPILSSIDITEAFYNIRMHKDSQHYTAFQTRLGLFEFTVSPMGLTNSPATFLKLMNRIFRDVVDVCVSFYMDDILIYSSTMEQHARDIKNVLTRLREHNLTVKPSKCIFGVSELTFCGMIINGEGVRLGLDQITSMTEHPQITSRKQLLQFLGSARFFADFIPWIGHLASPLFELTSKKVTWVWNVDHQTLVRVLQFYMTSSPCLKFFEPGRPTVVHTDASDFAIGGWIGQTHTVDGVESLCPVTYWSRKLTLAERKYPVHLKEHLAMKEFITRFRMYLWGEKFTAVVDHRSLEYLVTQPKLSSQQIRWVEALCEFDFEIRYEKGITNTFADLLSRRADYARITCPNCHVDIDEFEHIKIIPDDVDILTETLSKRKKTPKSVSFAADIESSDHSTSFDSVVVSLMNSSEMPDINASELLRLQLDDPFCQQLEEWSSNSQKIPSKKRGFFKSFSKLDGLWIYQHAATVIPAGHLRLYFLEYFHDRIDKGHLGFVKLRELMIRSVFWPSIDIDIRLFIRSCDLCQLTKAPNQSPFGLLHSLQISEGRADHISIDFATMPTSKTKYNSMMVIVCRLTKFVVGIPTKSTLTAKACAELLYTHWFLKGYGFPLSIVSDRDKLFVSNIWQEFCTLIGAKRNMSTARHQQTDGQSEISIKIIKEALARHCNQQQNDWDNCLAAVLFAYNNSIHSTTGFSPFYLMNAFEPRTCPSFTSGKATSFSEIFIQHQRDLEQAHDNIAKAQARQSNEYNKHHSKGLLLKIGDFVLLNRNGINYITDINSPKILLQRYLGPFEVIDIDLDRDNYTLRLPSTMKCHNVFHVRCLKKYFEPAEFFPLRESMNNPAPVDTENGDEWEVAAIEDTKLFRNVRKFLVRWTRYHNVCSTWEPISSLTNCVERLREFLESREDMEALKLEITPGLGLGGVLYSEECKESVVTPGHVIPSTRE
jgi:hypothetical protein